MKSKNDGVQQVSRKAILDAIDSEMQRVYDWGSQINEKRIDPDYISRAIQHAYKAEALIELLEVHDCGSTGGFDLGAGGLYSLEERIKLLKRKYRKTKKRMSIW